MKKRIFSLFLAICMLASVMTGLELTASAATSGTCGDNLTWTLDDSGTLTISGSGEMDNWSYDIAPWYSISDNIISVTIESGVTSIGEWAFEACESLTSVTIPDSVISIGEYAFGWCESLTSVTIPDSVISIGDWAFYKCRILESVIIPDNLTSIGNRAFSSCSFLTNVTISDSVTSIGENAFFGCRSLASIEVGSNNENYSSLDGNLFDKNKTVLLQYAIGKRDTQYTIPDSVTSIGYCAFYGCRSLTSVTIPDSVTSIGDYAFSYCNKLTSITVDSNNENYSSLDGNLFDKNKTVMLQYAIGKQDTQYIIPDSVTSIGYGAFSSCESLTNVIIPDSVTSIGYGAFEACEGLTSVTIPDSVTSIGDYAFEGCSSLTSVAIPDSVTSIGDYAFYDCSSLTSVTIGNSVTSIGRRAFSGCTLTDVYYTGSEEEWGEISIGSDNENLTDAEIHYNYIPEADCSGTIGFNKETNIITVESTKAIPKAELTVAVFKDGKFVGMQPQSISIAEGENTIESPITNYTGSDTVKIMIWDSITGMKPLFDCCSVNY